MALGGSKAILKLTKRADKSIQLPLPAVLSQSLAAAAEFPEVLIQIGGFLEAALFKLENRSVY